MIYINSKNQKLMLSLDWLQWSGFLIGAGRNDLPDLECPDTYRLEILDGNQVFKYRAILYDCLGNKMLTILWCPKSPLIQYNLVTFQVANQWFYQIEDIQLVVALAAQCFIYQFGTFSRIDICCDFEKKRHQHSVIKGLYHHKIVCCGKRNGNCWWSKTDGDMFPHDFGFGSLQSSVKWKLYNKSLELKVGEEVEEKPYIIERWLENKMNKYKIWRLEVSIQDFNKFYIKDVPIGIKETVTYSGKTMALEDLTDINIYSIFCDLYEKRFQLRKTGHTRVCNDERVYIVDLEKIKIVVPVKPHEGNHIDNSTMHSLIKIIESDQCKRNERLLSSSCDALYWYVKFNNLEGLFNAIKGKALMEWIEEKKSDVGEGIRRKLEPKEECSF